MSSALLDRRLDRDAGRGRLRGHPTGWRFEHWRPEGKLDEQRLLWTPHTGELVRGPRRDDPVVPSLVGALPVRLNSTADEGETDIADVYFDDQAVRSALYGRLFNDTPVETDSLSTLTGEASGNGYGAATWTRGTDWTVASSVATGAQKTFSASGGSWGPVTYFVMATVASGTAGLLVLFVALSTSRTLTDGDSLDATPTYTQS